MSDLKQRCLSLCKEGSYQELKNLLENDKGAGEFIDLLVTLSSGYGNIEILELAKQHGGNLDCKNGNAFGNACRYGRCDIVEYLLKNGVDVTSQNYYGLCWAVRNKHIKIVKNILASGVSVNIRDNFLLNLSVEINDYNMTKMFLEMGIDANGHENFPIVHASKKGYLSTVALLVDYDVDVSTDKSRALSSMCYFGNLEIVRKIIAKGAKVTDNSSMAVSQACLSEDNDKLQVIEYLVSHGADLHNREDICMVYVCKSGGLDVLLYLIKQGLDIAAHDRKTIKNCVRFGQYQLAEELLENNIKIDDIYDELIDMAKKNKDTEIIDLINEFYSSSDNSELDSTDKDGLSDEI